MFGWDLKDIEALVLAAILVGGGWYYGHTRYEAGKSNGDREVATLKAQYAEATTKAAAAARAKEQESARQMTAIEVQHLEDVQHAQFNAQRIVVDLHAGTVRLRDRWTCPRVPAAGSSSGSAATAADDRDQSAARIVQAADEADATIRALQAIVKADRQ